VLIEPLPVLSSRPKGLLEGIAGSALDRNYTVNGARIHLTTKMQFCSGWPERINAVAAVLVRHGESMSLSVWHRYRLVPALSGERRCRPCIHDGE
jgi:hypothetical protein